MDLHECMDQGEGEHLGPIEPVRGPRGDPRQTVRCATCHHRWATDEHATPTPSRIEAARGTRALAHLVLLTGSRTDGPLTQEWARDTLEA